jgi:hypothetical protein
VSLLSTEVAKLTQEREYREQQVKVMQQMAEEDLKVRKVRRSLRRQYNTYRLVATLLAYN